MDIKTDTRKTYLERINKVLVFIDENIDEKLDIETLSGISNFSQYHFHRIMSAHLNEPLGSFVKRLRMDRAANLLEHSGDNISEIALNMGYDSPSSFTKAFKKRFGVSPAEYRQSKRSFNYLIELSQIVKDKVMIDITPKIKKLKSKKVVFVQKFGAYDNEDTSKAWATVCEFAKKNRLFGFSTEFIGISHDDPKVTETEKLRYDACVSVRKEINAEGEVGYKELEGGTYAVFRHNGPYENFNETYNYIYKRWLPESGQDLRDYPCFELYLNSPDKTLPEKLKTDIYVPLK